MYILERKHTYLSHTVYWTGKMWVRARGLAKPYKSESRAKAILDNQIRKERLDPSTCKVVNQ